MARARNIKPGYYANEDLAECSVWARYIFPGLWMLADREGRLEDRPKRIKGELLRFDDQPIEPLLAELASKKDAQGIPFIVRYQNSDGRFIQISKFSVHQTPHYSEKQSVIKPPSFPESPSDDGLDNPGALQEHSGNSPGLKGGSQPPDSLNPDSLNPDCSDSGSSNPPSKQSKKTRKKPGTPAPETFEVTDDMAQWAVDEGVAEERLGPETRKFLDHHRARGTLFADWNAAWRTWIRKAVEFAKR